MEPGDVGRGDGIVVTGEGEGGVERGEVRGDDRRGDIWLNYECAWVHGSMCDWVYA